jgi:lyso-ornithine lipid O-acyltransferase
MIRLVPRVAAMLLGLIACVPLHYLWRLARRPSPWPRRFLWWVGFAAGLRVKVEGRPLGSHVLFLSNHVSWLDILVMAGATGAAFVSKAEVRKWPLVGWLAGLNDTIFVERSEKRGVRGQADALRAALASGRAIALFPEGTTEGGHDVLPFRASLLASLFPPLPRVRVQPAAIDYGRAVHDIAWVGEEGAVANAKLVLSRKASIPVTLRFLDPVDPHVYGDRKSLAHRSRAEIVEALTAFEAEADRLYGPQ